VAEAARVSVRCTPEPVGDRVVAAMSDQWASPEDIRRASSAAEAAKALAWQSEQTEIAAQRLEALELFRGDPAARAALEERWAALKPDPGDHRGRRVVEHE
jgi:hypothetical protein